MKYLVLALIVLFVQIVYDLSLGIVMEYHKMEYFPLFHWRDACIFSPICEWAVHDPTLQLP